MCTNSAAECVYSLGIALTKPFLYQANLATKVFGKNFRPGKSFEALPPAQKAWKVLRVATVFTVIIPLVTAIVALVGLLLRLCASVSRPKASLLHNSKIPFKEAPEIEELHLMTYNTALMPGFIRNLNNMRSSHARAHEIGIMFEAMEKEGKAPDVLCLQECFDCESTKILCDHLKTIYPDIVYNVSPNEFGLNSGLIIASKYKINEVNSGCYTDTGGEDALANKGFVGISLDFNDAGKWWVFNTHLQAKMGPSYDQIRKQQMTQLQAHLPKENTHICVTGDFNHSKFDELGKHNPDFEHNFLGDSFRNLHYDIQNGNVAANVQQSSSWFCKTDPSWGQLEWNKKTVQGCVLDHIFLSHTTQVFSFHTAILTPELPLMSGHSDHLYVMAHLKIIQTSKEIFSSTTQP